MAAPSWINSCGIIDNADKVILSKLWRASYDVDEISGSRGGEYEDDFFLQCRLPPDPLPQSRDRASESSATVIDDFLNVVAVFYLIDYNYFGLLDI
jgi:hypothetical protein